MEFLNPEIVIRLVRNVYYCLMVPKKFSLILPHELKQLLIIFHIIIPKVMLKYF